MPMLDISLALGSPMLQDTFSVIRRMVVVGTDGEQTLTPSQIDGIGGVVTAGGDDALVRNDSEQHMSKTISVVTSYRLRGPSAGTQPDIVLWHGDNFVVRLVDDYSAFGPGFVQAICDSIDSLDLPPNE